MSLPRAVEQNKREEFERLLRSGSDVNEKDGVRYIIKHTSHKFVYIFVIYIVISYVDRYYFVKYNECSGYPSINATSTDLFTNIYCVKCRCKLAIESQVLLILDLHSSLYELVTFLIHDCM